MMAMTTINAMIRGHHVDAPPDSDIKMKRKIEND
jgi:hypothetical protein